MSKNNMQHFRDLWGEGRHSQPRQSAGVAGGFMWALIIGLAALIIWIRHDFGKEMAGFAVLGLVGALLVLIGQWTSIAQRKVDGHIEVEKQYAVSPVLREQAKGNNILLKSEADLERKLLPLVFRMAQTMARQMKTEDPHTIDIDPFDER